VLVRELKKLHFDAAPARRTIYWRRRGDTTYHPFTAHDFDAVRKEFAAAERRVAGP